MARPKPSPGNKEPRRCWMCGQVCPPGTASTQLLIGFLGNPAPWRCRDVDSCIDRYMRINALSLKWPEPFCGSRSLQDCLRFLVASGVTPDTFATATASYLSDVEATR